MSKPNKQQQRSEPVVTVAAPEPKPTAQAVEECSNCHFRRNGDECHFNPPQIWFPYPGESGRHVHVTPSGWCGQWRKKA